jgi:hypothetical protein
MTDITKRKEAEEERETARSVADALLGQRHGDLQLAASVILRPCQCQHRAHAGL